MQYQRAKKDTSTPLLAVPWRRNLVLVLSYQCLVWWEQLNQYHLRRSSWHFAKNMSTTANYCSCILMRLWKTIMLLTSLDLAPMRIICLLWVDCREELCFEFQSLVDLKRTETSKSRNTYCMLVQNNPLWQPKLWEPCQFHQYFACCPFVCWFLPSFVDADDLTTFLRGSTSPQRDCPICVSTKRDKQWK